MPVLIRAVDDRCTGKVYLTFPYDPATIAAIKSIPGSRWEPSTKRWITSDHGLSALESQGLKFDRVIVSENRATIPPGIAERLRPYQLEAAEKAIRRAGTLFSMDPRVGKTPTAIAWLTALMSGNIADCGLVFYPASVRQTWHDELLKWAGIYLYSIEGRERINDRDYAALRAAPYFVIGCHWEILQYHTRDLHEVLEGKRFGLIGDEVHVAKNRKSARYKAAKSFSKAAGGIASIGTSRDEDYEEFISGTCVGRVGLTGTPMRNRSRDLYGVIDFVSPDSMGGYWTYAKRYTDAHVNDMGFWQDKGESNQEELNARLAAISYRKTRAEVAQWLPKSERVVIACHMPTKDMTKYRRLERALAKGVAGGLDDSDASVSDRDAMKTLAMATASGKIPTAIDRVYYHADRGAKTLVFANFHETLKALDEALDVRAEELAQHPEEGQVVPHFCAGGWMTPVKRGEIIAQWKACPGPAVLLANTIASGIGIDLSDAETAVFLELTWVPADFIQAEARIQDIHLGKRSSPPLYEYLIVKDTIDEAMAATLLEKVRAIETVVGKDAETSGVASTLRDSGVINTSRFGLANTDKETVAEVMAKLREKLLGKRSSVSDTTQSLAADAEEAFGDDEVDEEPDSTEEVSV